MRQRSRDVRAAWEIRTDPTYRRLASSYELPGGFRRIYCYHVRKTAGTSLHLSFMALGGEDPMDVYERIVSSRLHRTISGDYSFVSFNRRLLAEGAYFYGRSHRAAVAQPLPPETFTVTVLRDPVERVHSYFDYLVAGDDPAMPGPVPVAERRLASEGFDAFLERVPRELLQAQLAMFSDRFDVTEAVERIGACSSVFFTEDFAAGLAALGRRLELPLVGRRARVTGRRSSLTESQRRRLQSRLEPEYELVRRLDEGRIARIDSGNPG
ncbi:MAG TPA: hypothetical protein VMV06_07685 [Acidimicrobiales bacterium]|nr:hypothetical protein [Acidimicrobiales bacterium]